MSISSIGSSSANALYSPTVQPKAEAGEAQKAGRDAVNDGDSDDGAASAVQAPTPSVNLNGQTVGALINAVA